MAAYRFGSDFSFMTKESSAVLRPVAFGGRRSRGNEIRLHSHLGECFAGDWAINKNCHMLFGQRFVWVTDCYAAHFILSYDGNNPAVLRLQMRLMSWDIDIVHRNDIHLTDADYWSRLGADICFDPLFKSYLDFDRGLRQRFTAPTSLPMKPENMPYYRGPRVTMQTDSAESDHPATTPHTDPAHESHCQFVLTAMTIHNCHGLSHLSNVPVRFGNFSDGVTPISSLTKSLLMRTASFISIGLSIPLEVAILSQLCCPEIFRSRSCWLVTSTTVVAHYFASSQLVLISLAAVTISSIIFGHRATTRRFTATSSTLFVSGIAIRHHPSGSFNCPL